jgi:putative SOS response-associated peptidase YedK
MCGRFTLRNFEQVREDYNILIEASYNISPSQQVLVVKKSGGCEFLDWSFSPLWASKPFNLINVKYDSLDIKPSFIDYQKCVFLVDGWFEWERLDDGSKKVMFMHLGNKIFFFAGIYNKTGAAIVTIEAHPNLQNIHHRQPMVLDKSELEYWFEAKNKKIYSKVLEQISFYEVSKYVNSPRNNDTNCIKNI